MSVLGNELKRRLDGAGGEARAMTASGRASELPERGRGIGSSDIAAISGLNPWRKPIDVWLEKTGRAKSGPATDAMQAGQRIEPVLAEWYADRVGLRRDQLRSSETLRDSDEAWILATPDRIVATEPEKLLEIKVVGSRLVDHWRDGIPDYVLAQVQWQMHVSGIPSADIAALLGGSELRILACPYFEELAQELVEMGRAFWFEHVQKDLPPRVDGSESWRRYLRARWPAEKRSIERAPPEAEVLVEGLFAAKELFERTRERKVAAENALKLLIGDAAGLRGSTWEATWKATRAGAPDWKTLALERGATPDQIEEYKRPGTRRLLLRKRAEP